MSALVQLSVQEQAYDQARQRFEGLVQYMDSGEADSMSHSDLERELEEKARELMRQLLQEHLKKRGLRECEKPVCDADGREHGQQRVQQRQLETIFGTVTT